jgi:serine phosphatase RsbU (regulator of sigma subunit)
MRPDGQEFGEAGLLSAVRTGKDSSPSELKTHLLTRVNEFCNSQLHDDATLMVVAALEDSESCEGSNAEWSGIRFS